MLQGEVQRLEQESTGLRDERDFHAAELSCKEQELAKLQGVRAY